MALSGCVDEKQRALPAAPEDAQNQAGGKGAPAILESNQRDLHSSFFPPGWIYMRNTCRIIHDSGSKVSVAGKPPCLR